MSRYGIIQSIKSALEGLEVNVRDEPRFIHTTDTLVDPTLEARENLPFFTITAGPETDDMGLYGFSPINCNFKLDMFGFTDGALPSEVEDERKSRLSKAAEDIIRAIKKKLTDPTWLDTVNCDFSITQIGPITVEHMEMDDPFAYISMPLSISYLDDVQTDTDE
jgi:hypothetical protein